MGLELPGLGCPVCVTFNGLTVSSILYTLCDMVCATPGLASFFEQEARNETSADVG